MQTAEIIPNQTKLSIKVNVRGSIALSFKPDKEQLQAASVIKLENGRFTTPDSISLQTTAPVNFDFEDDNRTLKIVSTGKLVVDRRSGQFSIIFPPNQISVSGVGVALDGTPTPIALMGEMTHRPQTGDFFVATTNNPRGNILASQYASRVLSRKP